MAQNISLNKDGIDFIHLGADINAISVKPLKNHPNKKHFELWFEDSFQYYYLDKKDIQLHEEHKVEYLFIATNPNENIVSIIIYIKDSSFSTVDLLFKVFGDPFLNSTSSIDGLKRNNKFFWKTASGVSVLYTKYQSSNHVKIELYKLPFQENAPGISFHF